MSSIALNVGRFEPLTLAMGPGRRACLWVRGCPINCPGCITADLIPSEPRRLVALDEVWSWIAAAHKTHGLEGISFSGGEPFEQASALAELAARARALGLSVMSWSGYTYARLTGKRAPANSAKFLSQLDVVIDGPFVQKLFRIGVPHRGSTNQRIRFLTDRYAPADFARSRIEACLRPDGSLTVNGVGDYDAVRSVLEIFGLES